MGTASSIQVASSRECETDKSTFGERVEITRNLPVENFGKNDAAVHRSKDVAGEPCLSAESISDSKERNCRSSPNQRKTTSIRSVLALLGRSKGDGITDLARSECTAEMIEAAELKLNRVIQLKSNVEAENVRLKKELNSLRSSHSKWKNESEKAREDEKLALVRAANLENELDRVRRQFKCYRDGKEKEIHNLMRMNHEQENALRHYSGENKPRNYDKYPLPERLIAPFDNDLSIENLSLFEVPGILEDGRVSDCNAVFPLLTQVMTTAVKRPSKKRTFKFFLTADKEGRTYANKFKEVFVPKLRQLCEQHSKFFVIVEAYNTSKPNNDKCSREPIQLDKCDLFFGILANPGNRFTLDEWKKLFVVFSEKGHSVTLCVKHDTNASMGGTELTHFIDYVSVKSKAKVVFYSRMTDLVEQNEEELQKRIREHFEIDSPQEPVSISDEELVTDCESSFLQLEILRQSVITASSDIRFAKYECQLNEYVAGAGPSPPLLVSGASGVGKTCLLANWISMQLSAGKNVVLYHFVESCTSDRSTKPVYVVRRMAAQLLGLVPGLFSMLHCDPVKFEEYFPRLLETVAARINTTVVIVIDGVDKLQNFTTCSHLSWLNDPLPANARVILSLAEGNQPNYWRSWPAVNISSLTEDESRHVLLSLMCNEKELERNEAARLVKELSDTAIASPLFLTMLAHELSRSSSLPTSIKEYSSFKTVAELTIYVLKSLEEQKRHLVNQVLALIWCSRCGLAEAEIMELLSLQWDEWVPVLNSLVFDRPILVERNGLLVISHEQVLRAVLLYLCEEDILRKSRERLVEFYLEKLRTSCVSHSIIDQVPWLLEKLDQKDKLRDFLSRIDVFTMFFQRSLYSELLGYWKYLNVDSTTFGNIYFKEIKKKEEGTPTLEIAYLYETLGRFLKGLDVLPLAMKSLERSFEIKEMLIEPDDLLIGQSLHYLADLYLLLGNLESAELSYKQTLEINENALGKNHSLVAKELESLAYVKKKQNKEKASAEFQRKAARIRQQSALTKMPLCSLSNHLDPSFDADGLASGRMSTELATSLNNLGGLFIAQKRYQEAEIILKKCLVMRESLLGDFDPAVTETLDCLGTLYLHKKMYSEAVWNLKRSLEIKKKNLDSSDPDFISTMNRLAMALRREGDYKASERTYREVLTAQRLKLDENDPEIATALHNLAVVVSEQENVTSGGKKRLHEALNLFEQALAIYKNTLGSCHPKVAETLKNLAKVHLDMGDNQQASFYLRKSIMIQENDLTVTTLSSHPSLAAVSSADDNTLDLAAQ